MSIEAMKMALEALDDLIVYSWDDGKVGEPDKTEDYAGIKAMEALRAAIEQAEKQEPVAWGDNVEGIGFKKPMPNANYRVTATIVPPQREWQGLTDEEISELWGEPLDCMYSGHYDAIRAIEQTIKEKNT